MAAKPGFLGNVKTVQKRYGEWDGNYLAVTITYFGFLSLFPLMLLALSVVGFVLAGDPGARTDWVDRVADAVPGLEPFVSENLETVVATRAGVGIVGFLGLLWTATSLTEAAGRAVSLIHGAPRHRTFLRRKSWSLITTLVLGSLAVIGMAVVGIAGAIPGAATLLGVPVTLAVDFALFLFAYRLLVQRPGPRLGMLWPGALFAGVGWTMLKVAGAWYAARTVTGATMVYGAFGSVIGVLALLYLGSRLFVYGAVINAVTKGDPGGSEQPSRSLR